MKFNYLIIIICVLKFSFSFSQSNSIPNNGNVGIGTINPTSKLQVNGTARIDSVLIVKDSAIFHKSARVKSDLKVDGKSILKNDVLIKEGNLKIKSLGDTTLFEPGVLLIDKNGKVINGGDIKSLIYSFSANPQTPCPTDLNGNIIQSNPIWLNSPGILYTSNNCVPDIKVGIGKSNPQAKLHIQLNNQTTKAIIVQGNNQSKILQLNADGLLYAREIKVDLQNEWPDYVFEGNYNLMTIEDLNEYIKINKHLPNVPSADEMKSEGINLANTNVLLMEKIEELTLYMIKLQEQLKLQELEIEKLKSNSK